MKVSDFRDLEEWFGSNAKVLNFETFKFNDGYSMLKMNIQYGENKFAKSYFLTKDKS